jgi:hypothetical protein
MRRRGGLAAPKTLGEIGRRCRQLVLLDVSKTLPGRTDYW